MEWLFTLLGVIALDIILSGDNAVVIASVAAQLPKEQQAKAINFGMASALILRIVFLLLAAVILSFSFLSILGGIGLLVIAVKLSVDMIKKNTGVFVPVGTVGSMTAATGAIMFADVSMSFDNVMSVAGLAHQHPAIMVLGVILSIFLLTKATKWLVPLLEKYTWLNWVGVGLIVVAAINLLER